MKALISRFAKDESGTTAIEYGLIAGLISVACISAAVVIGPKVQTMWTSLQTAVTSAVP